MPRKIPLALWLALPTAFLLYFFHLNGTGLLGPDEPRYSWIAREMARSGDWITPRLWGEPWFEKPVLLYWMGGLGFRLGLGPELATRLPVALLALAFLAFFWWILNREYGCRAAWLSTLILGTSAAWIGFSQVAVTDLPLTVTFSAAMLLALPWITRGETRFLPAVSALLGVAVLAKGLVPLVLAAPLVIGWRRIRDVLRPRVILPFFVVALPWYVLCYRANGWTFLHEFFIVHHFDRFATDALAHVQPWWFYLPIVLALLLPWLPLVGLTAMARPWKDPKRVFLVVWLLFGLCFFSASTNKLPGYVLPLIPPLAALMGITLDEARSARVWLLCCALLVFPFLAAAPILAPAVAHGLSRSGLPGFSGDWLLPALAAWLAWRLESHARRLAAVTVIAVTVAGSIAFLKVRALPDLDRMASARVFAREVAPNAADTCVEFLERDLRYGLAYYLGTSLPDCKSHPLKFHIIQTDGQQPRIEP